MEKNQNDYQFLRYSSLYYIMEKIKMTISFVVPPSGGVLLSFSENL